MDDTYAQPPVLPKQKPGVDFRCPRCGDFFLLRAEDVPESGMEVGCPHCHLDFRRRLGPQHPSYPVDVCWVCGCTELYIQKDFNQTLGLLITLASVILSLLVLVIIDPFVGIACLAVLALSNVAVYRLLSTCAVCYRCRSVYRGFPASPRHFGYFVGRDEWEEGSRQEWLRGLLPSGDGRASPHNQALGGRR